MKIDFENPELVVKITKYYGEMPDGREFQIFCHENDSSTWVKDVETDGEFTEDEIEQIINEFYESL